MYKRTELTREKVMQSANLSNILVYFNIYIVTTFVGYMS
jgi:hypothetical protein